MTLSKNNNLDGIFDYFSTKKRGAEAPLDLTLNIDIETSDVQPDQDFHLDLKSHTPKSLAHQTTTGRLHEAPP